MPSRSAIYNGSQFRDFLTGTSADDELYGFGNDDRLTGNGGNDILDGGAGSDEMRGGTGDDTYILRRGDGSVPNMGFTDLIWENAGEGTDKIRIVGVLPSEVLFSGAGSTFRITIDDGAGNLLVTHVFSGSNLWDYVEAIEFDDGTIINATTGLQLVGTSGDDQLLGAGSNDALIGNGGNDRLEGRAGANTLDGGAGADLMLGGSGDDTFIIDRGDGTLKGATVTDYLGESPNAGTDTIRIRGVLPSEVFIYHRGAEGHVIALFDDHGVLRETLVAGNFTLGFLDLIERIEFDDGTVWDATTGIIMNGMSTDDVIQGSLTKEVIFGNNGADTLSGLGGDDILNGGRGTDRLFGDAGHDILQGGRGADEMWGGDGDDTYRVAVGDGKADGSDYIVELLNQGNDTLRLEGIAVSELVMKSYSITGPAGVTGLAWYFGLLDDNSYLYTGVTPTASGDLWDYIESIEFDDGTQWTAATGLTQRGTSGNEEMWATLSGDDMYGMGGDDTLQGRDGNDLLVGGTGNDLSWGRAGDDTFIVALGDGSATQGLDTLREDFNAGYDTIRFTNVSVSNFAITMSAGMIHFGLGDGAGTWHWTSVGIGSGNPEATFWNMFEEIIFDDGTTWTSAVRLQGFGTELDDLIVAFGDGGTIFGNGGDDTLQGGAAVDTLFGDAGEDTLTGGAEADILIGGLDADFMAGGEDGDTYRIFRGDGGATEFEEIIFEASNTMGTDILHFAGGITLADLLVTYSENEISFGVDDGTGTYLWTAIRTFNTTNGFSDLFRMIEEIHFDDGTVITENTVFILNGTTGDDVLVGNSLPELVLGGPGEDILDGGLGRDTLRGGADNDILIDSQGYDTMQGDGGADLFVFHRNGDGAEILDFEQGVDAIDISQIVGDYGTILFRNFDTPIDVRGNRGTGDDAYVVITFLEQADDLGISISYKGSVLGGNDPFSVNISLTGGFDTITQSADLFVW